MVRSPIRCSLASFRSSKAAERDLLLAWLGLGFGLGLRLGLGLGVGPGVGLGLGLGLRFEGLLLACRARGDLASHAASFLRRSCNRR